MVAATHVTTLVQRGLPLQALPLRQPPAGQVLGLPGAAAGPGRTAAGRAAVGGGRGGGLPPAGQGQQSPGQAALPAPPHGLAGQGQGGAASLRGQACHRAATGAGS